jgi:hypothetical protein
MVTITHALRQVKEEVANLLSPSVIRQVCEESGYRWRRRTLDPVTTIHLFLLQILHRNAACTHLPHLAGKRFTAAAYCQARMRLPVEVLKRLVHRTTQAAERYTRGLALWHGHRTWKLDGSSFYMPDTPSLQKHFGQPGGQKRGCGFPVAHLLTVFDAASGVLQQVVISPLRTHDMTHIQKVHPTVREGDIVIADRGFCSFAHLALLLRQKSHAVFRVHQRQIVDFRCRRPHAQGKNVRGRPRSRWLKRLGYHDQVVEWLKPKVRPRWIAPEAFAALPESITVRELRYTLLVPGLRTRTVTLVTTLLDPIEYPPKDLAELYRGRWQIETNLCHLKRSMGMEVLHCKTVDGVTKELLVYVLVYNLVRLVMIEAAHRHCLPLDRVSFVDALRWLGHARPGEDLPPFVLNPHRPNRVEPRAVKRRPKEYDRLNQPRRQLRKALERKRHAA